MARYQFSYGEDDDSSSESESKSSSSSSSETPSSNIQLNSQSSNTLPRANTRPFARPFNELILLDHNSVNEKPTSPTTPPQVPTFFNPHPGITPRRTTPSKRSFLPPLTPSLPIISHSPTTCNRPRESTPRHSHSPSPCTPTITPPSKKPQHTCVCTPTLNHLLLQTTLLTESNNDQTARLLALHTLYRESRGERKSHQKCLQKLTHALEKTIDATTWYRSLIETQEREISEAETNRQEAETARTEAGEKSREMGERIENLEREIELWRVGWEESARRAGGL
ncbi:hypothetical protein BGAL_0338g00130 [Botrytis galanthina]|uniref:Uncharacterized protein n=1 Tax=Botrytis galanthina TaxID=278940 RepID=A0A4S8QU85_9HELO|nr:hypothetical protein BGAL_0338g00130 [Botrytis galanthina]